MPIFARRSASSIGRSALTICGAVRARTAAILRASPAAMRAAESGRLAELFWLERLRVGVASLLPLNGADAAALQDTVFQPLDLAAGHRDVGADARLEEQVRVVTPRARAAARMLAISASVGPGAARATRIRPGQAAAAAPIRAL